jgi:hypothetical protein
MSDICGFMRSGRYSIDILLTRRQFPLLTFSVDRLTESKWNSIGLSVSLGWAHLVSRDKCTEKPVYGTVNHARRLRVHCRTVLLLKLESVIRRLVTCEVPIKVTISCPPVVERRDDNDHLEGRRRVRCLSGSAQKTTPLPTLHGRTGLRIRIHALASPSPSTPL